MICKVTAFNVFIYSKNRINSKIVANLEGQIYRCFKYSMDYELKINKVVEGIMKVR